MAFTPEEESFLKALAAIGILNNKVQRETEALDAFRAVLQSEKEKDINGKSLSKENSVLALEIEKKLAELTIRTI